jgi:hypothetical protein
MDASILTTIFCLILLVLMVLALNELTILKRKANAQLDRTDMYTDKLHNIISILQQLETKQDLLFNNAPPAPGEAYWSQMPGVNSQPDPNFPDFRVFAESEPVYPIPVNVPFEQSRYNKKLTVPKKRGRPKKASN